MKIKNILVPAIAILVMAALLLAVGMGTNELRAANIQKEHVEMMRLLLSGSENFTLEPYTGEDANIVAVHKAENGFVIETTVQGYAGNITMMTGVNNDGRVTGVVIRDMEETLGLGRNALTDHEFLYQLLNTSGETEVGTNVDAITGATVTSRAVVRSVNSAIAVVTGADASSSATTWGG